LRHFLPKILKTNFPNSQKIKKFKPAIFAHSQAINKT